jgi:chromosome partitioning protein
MATAVEQMADRHAPIGVYAPKSPAAKAFSALWQAVERRISDRR